jgi:hypothetical protein
MAEDLGHCDDFLYRGLGGALVVCGSWLVGIGGRMVVTGSAGSAVILADDVTVVGVADNPLLVVTGGTVVVGGVGMVAGGIVMAAGELIGH